MFLNFYNGKKGKDDGCGFGYAGQINGTDMLSIRPQNRGYWLQIYDSGGELEIIQIENHEVADVGDVPDCRKGKKIL